MFFPQVATSDQEKENKTQQQEGQANILDLEQAKPQTGIEQGGGKLADGGGKEEGPKRNAGQGGGGIYYRGRNHRQHPGN